MIVVTVAAACGAEAPLRVRYEQSGGGALEFSRDLTVQVQGAPARVFVPVFSIESFGQVSRFAHVDVPPAWTPCVRVARARELERLPLMLDATLPHDWSSQPLYQQLYLGSALPERVWLRVARWWPRVAQLG